MEVLDKKGKIHPEKIIQRVKAIYEDNAPELQDDEAVGLLTTDVNLFLASLGGKLRRLLCFHWIINIKYPIEIQKTLRSPS